MAARGGRTAIQLKVARIWVPPGRRPLDQAHVANLAVSMEEIGQRHPISVQTLPDDHPQRPTYTYRLNAGAHRLAAHELKSWPVIDAVVEDDSDHEARLAEVDENLIRRDYTSLERAQAIAARLEAWTAKYPARATADEDGAQRAKRGRPVKMDHGDPISPRMGFADEASAKSGLSIPTIKRDLALYRGIPAGLQARLISTPLADNAGLLRQLAGMGDKAEQEKVVYVLLNSSTKNFSDARAIAAGNAPSKAKKTGPDAAVKAFRTIWKAASPSARAAILHDLAGSPLPKGWIVREADRG